MQGRGGFGDECLYDGEVGGMVQRNLAEARAGHGGRTARSGSSRLRCGVSRVESLGAGYTGPHAVGWVCIAVMDQPKIDIS